VAKEPTEKSELRTKVRLLLSREYRDLSSSAKILYTHLTALHAWLKHGNRKLPISKSDRILSAETGLCDTAITNAKRELVSLCWIRIQNGAQKVSSKYWILKTDCTFASPVSRGRNRGHNVVDLKRRNTGKTKPETPLKIATDICGMLQDQPDELITPPRS
jgi:hypothetical protein